MKFFYPEQYQTKCIQRFLHFREKILNLLPFSSRVEHIGASSIPGAISKGDLDIFVGVEPSVIENAIIMLQSLGFEEKLDTLRTSELCMLESPFENVAIQVVANGSKFEFFLTFRDLLSSSPQLVEEYNNLKMSCVGLTHSEYREKKSAFVERVLAQA
ncbi:GrpB family protein [Zooshikella harenae]|uniref:GrpB family protein n=1 Tax=Zooshikella harenae TaxID=2827238 RepID=A0ABS5Z6H0_9GAMM|nr:GrpB family protein [Zooshikella harenae]MBU2709652.1 GrpB family protein [Zooshikella harenae]